MLTTSKWNHGKQNQGWENSSLVSEVLKPRLTPEFQLSQKTFDYDVICLFFFKERTQIFYILGICKDLLWFLKGFGKTRGSPSALTILSIFTFSDFDQATSSPRILHLKTERVQFYFHVPLKSCWQQYADGGPFWMWEGSQLFLSHQRDVESKTSLIFSCNSWLAARCHAH